MKIDPYLYFNGNAAEVIALYEIAFGGKAVIARYKDVGLYDKSYSVPEGMDNHVMHANMNLGDSMIMFCDMPEKTIGGERVQLMVSFDSIEKAKHAFDVLQEGGTVTMEPQKTFWSDCFASLKDKFGVSWLLSYENETQKAKVYGE